MYYIVNTNVALIKNSKPQEQGGGVAIQRLRYETYVAGSKTLRTALSHLDKINTYVRMLFIDYNSAFNTIVPSKIIIKLEALGLNPVLCNWILDFMTGRKQHLHLADPQH